jgi:hypothetical protein
MQKILYISILISILATSCSEPIDLNLNKGENNRLVVEGSITTEYKTHEIKLSRTADYFYDQQAEPELGAIVSVTDGEIIFNFYDTQNNGVYRTNLPCAGLVGHHYTLNIQLKNGEQYSATDTIRPVSPMDSIRCEYTKSENPFEKKYYYDINIFAQEDPKPGNCYQWELYFYGQDVTDTLRLKTFVNDDMVNGSYIYNWTVYRIPEYKLTKDTSEIILQMLSISKEKYDFYTAIMLETDYSGGPFSGPPANIPSNISNGAVGFFSASAVMERRLEIIKTHHKAYLNN